MNEALIKRLKETKAQLDGPEGLDEKELDARITMNDAIKAWEKIRIEREMVIMQISQMVGMLD